MSELAGWLRSELERTGQSQISAAVHAGVAVATVSAILNKGHTPKIETLFRLADYFETPRDEVLRLAGHRMAPDERQDDRRVRARRVFTHQPESDDPLERELLDEFRRLPDELKAAALQQVEVLGKLAQQPPFRIIGEEE